MKKSLLALIVGVVTVGSLGAGEGEKAQIAFVVPHHPGTAVALVVPHHPGTGMALVVPHHPGTGVI